MSQVRQSGGTAGAGCLILFGLPFAIAGVALLYFGISPIIEVRRMAAWEPVPMTILSAELDTNHDDDGVTYRVLAEYTYTYNGESHTGRRVGVHDGADNIDDYHQRLFEELERHRVRGTPYTGYVNPTNPDEAILDRNVRPAMIAFMNLMGFLFAGVGFGVIAAGFFGRKKIIRTNALRAAAPEKPWLWREDWKAGVLTSSNRKQMYTSIVFALLWNLISWPVGFFMLQSGGVPVWAMLIGALFPMVGIFLVGVAIRNVIRWFKFGESRFLPVSLPMLPGGTLSGKIEIPVYIHPDSAFAVCLKCVNRVTTGTGKQRSTTERTLSEQKTEVPANLADFRQNRVAFPVEIAVPAEQPESRSESNNEILWKLTAKAAVSGVDYAAEFEVPVFRTDEVSVFTRE